MTAKLSASADGTKVTIGTTAEDALQIDATAKTIKALAPYLFDAPQNSGSETKASTSGTEINFTIPAGAKKIEVLFRAVSTNGSNNLSVRLGGAGGVENVNYNTNMINFVPAGVFNNPIAATSGFNFATSADAANHTGVLTLNRVDPADNVWYGFGNLLNGTSGARFDSAGLKVMPGELTTLQVTTQNKVDLFDNGNITVNWSK